MARLAASPARARHAVDGPVRLLHEHRPELRKALEKLDLRPVFLAGDSSHRTSLPSESVDLVVTSPPYPYVERWDALFERALALEKGDLSRSVEHLSTIHDHLGRTWAECHRLLRPGGILCINVGDATRSVGGRFRLLANHVHVAMRCEQLGFDALVPLLWKKPTNKPNSFLGSGFAPPNAYVTLDCEHILIFRKGARRTLPAGDLLRRASCFSKVERDLWFSQVWELRGASQRDGRASFPEEIPYRLIRMFSLLGDTVLDPFAGSGRTLAVARREGRRAIGLEQDPALVASWTKTVGDAPPSAEEVLSHLEELYPASTAVLKRPRPRG